MKAFGVTDEMNGGYHVVSVLASTSNHTFWMEESLSFATMVGPVTGIEKFGGFYKPNNRSVKVHE